MRIVIIALLFFTALGSKAQSINKDVEKAQSPVAIAKNTSKYIAVYSSPSVQSTLKQQQQTWELQTVTAPQSAENWLNYYVSSKLYYQQKDKNQLSNTSKESLRQIAEKMDKKLTTDLSKSFEKQLVRYYETKESNYKQARKYLLNAYQLNPKNALLYPEMALHYEIEGNIAKRDAIIEKIENVNNNSTLFKFSTALIKTIPHNSIVFTNGEYDTYAMLKASKKRGKNIKVISVSLLKNSHYRTAILKRYKLKSTFFNAKQFTKYLTSVLSTNSTKEDIYISITVKSDILKPVAKNIYHMGFAYQYATSKKDNIGTLYANIMELDNTSLLGNNNKLLKNLMPAYILLYRHYKHNKTTAKKVYYKAKSFAQLAGFWGTKYEQYFK